MNKELTKTELAIANGHSVFRTKSIESGLGKSENVIKSGKKNKKLGHLVNVGFLSGVPLFQITLEERATCPVTCKHWATCYGNNMPFATRYQHGQALESRIWQELETLNTKHPNGFLVRLHVLGDFYSTEYVDLWERALESFDGLHVYGYTARYVTDKIGKAINNVKLLYPTRFRIRWSGRYTQDSALSADEYKAQLLLDQNEAFMCPEQLGKVDSCADCGACWNGRKPVLFSTH